MEQIITLSKLDILYDLFTAFLYFGGMLYAMYALVNVRDSLSLAYKILLLFLIAASSIYLYKTIFQVVNGTNGVVRLWDVYNLVQAFANLLFIRTFSRMIGWNMKDHMPITRNIPLI